MLIIKYSKYFKNLLNKEKSLLTRPIIAKIISKIIKNPEQITSMVIKNVTRLVISDILFFNY